MNRTEIQVGYGQLRFGMTSGAHRAWDLRRDRRVTIHGQGIDPPSENAKAWP
jgi:uncharacterized protein (UPF0548 family)